MDKLLKGDFLSVPHSKRNENQSGEKEPDESQDKRWNVLQGKFENRRGRTPDDVGNY